MIFLGGGVDIGYDVEGLRRAGGQHRSNSEAAATLSGLLAAIALPGQAVGTVPHAAGFHGAVVSARDTQAGDARQESTRRGDLAGRTDAAADFGETLIVITSDVARSGAPSAFPMSVAPPTGG